MEKAKGQWPGVAPSGAAIPAAIWCFTEVIHGCEELASQFGGYPAATTTVWRGCEASRGGWTTQAATGACCNSLGGC
ncbi:hypothetical protein Pyn_12547 [Prunus yedoensis var. nudiflora]|uniref:Uncharacterized protein n=1 Tax=Prunus yedoensis var. nudiflora TaxID=2094558 RepID=A0A314Y553_PRUYE|nr:hypothetical protein Pyn_12547 [Prunus yedoensis var. nudiflora]